MFDTSFWPAVLRLFQSDMVGESSLTGLLLVSAMAGAAAASDFSLSDDLPPSAAVDWGFASLSFSDDFEVKSARPKKEMVATVEVSLEAARALPNAVSTPTLTATASEVATVAADLDTAPSFSTVSSEVIAPVLVTDVATLTTAADMPQMVTEAEVLAATQSRQLGQISEITELTDVLPDDWAYQALASLVEEYSCIEGYPDLTYRGDRSMTRYEFAAGLNSCLDAIRLLIVENGISADDIATIQRLSAEFAAELAELGSRVEGLETEVAELRANQFSTVTKLRGGIFTHINAGFRDADILTERTFADNAFVGSRDEEGNPIVQAINDNSAVTFGYLSWINFDSSFTGSDKLTIQFVVGDGNSAANLYTSAGLFNTFGTPFTLQTGTPGGRINDVFIRELSYGFPIGEKLSVEVGPRINWYRFFDNNRYTIFLSGANSFNASGSTQVNAVDRGTGAIVVWDIADWADLRIGWLAENTEFLTTTAVPDPARGLFGGAHTLSAQLGLQPLDNLNLRFLYTRSRLVPNGAGQIGGATSEPFYGLADDGLGGALDSGTADTLLLNFDWTPVDWLGLFGRYSYGSTHLIDDGDDIGSVDAQSVQFGFAFPDLFKEGALGTVSYVMPFDILAGREFMVAGGGDGGTQQELEVSYRYPLSPHIAIMPSFYWVMNANNFDDNGNLYFLNLQTQLFF
ncbi:MAG: iron uptake porin [Cyanobacteria bacterium P01_C01_bin.147]